MILCMIFCIVIKTHLSHFICCKNQRWIKNEAFVVELLIFKSTKIASRKFYQKFSTVVDSWAKFETHFYNWAFNVLSFQDLTGYFLAINLF